MTTLKSIYPDQTPAIRIDSSDTTPSSYLSSKLVAGSNVTLTVNNPGADETIGISSTAGSSVSSATFELQGANTTLIHGTSTLVSNVGITVDTSTGLLTNPGGAPHYLNYGNSTDTQLGGTNFTIKTIISSTAWAVDPGFWTMSICGKRDSGGWEYAYYMYNGSIQFSYNSGTLVTWAFTPTGSNEYYVALVAQGSTITCYVNGVSLGSHTFSGITSTTHPFNILGDQVGAGNLSSIRAFRISKVAETIYSLPQLLMG